MLVDVFHVAAVYVFVYPSHLSLTASFSLHNKTLLSLIVVKVEYAVEAVSKSMYERLFKWLVMRINRILNRGAASSAAAHFMGILDVAGFEVFLVGNARIPKPF